jgi:hypothetical protein
MHRLTTNDAIGPTLPLDPMRPAELAVLDQLIGDWNGTMDVTLAEAGNRTVRSESTNHAAAILAGRFIEEKKGMSVRQDYQLTGWDEFRRAYRFWHFGADGDVQESDGAWDEAEKKLTWKSVDGRLNGAWTLTTPDERHITMAAKDAQGRRLYEVEGTARRAGTDAKPR